MRFTVDPRLMNNGTVLLFGIEYVREDRRPVPVDTMTQPKIFTYAMLKAGGLWYVTGSGKVPTAAGWGAVERWLERDDRRVVWVKAVVETMDILADQPAISAPTADHPHTDLGDGRTECDRCGKFIWPVTHSCKGVPVTESAMQRRRGSEWRDKVRTAEDDALGYHLD